MMKGEEILPFFVLISAFIPRHGADGMAEGIYSDKVSLPIKPHRNIVLHRIKQTLKRKHREYFASEVFYDNRFF